MMKVENPTLIPQKIPVVVTMIGQEAQQNKPINQHQQLENKEQELK